MRKLLYSFALCILLPAGAAAQELLVDKVAAVVGSEMILLSEVEEQLEHLRIQGITTEANIRCRVLESVLLQKLLLAQARIDSLKASDADVDRQVDDRLRMIMAQLGGEKATEAYFRKPIFQLKKDWRELMRESLLAEQMRAKVMKDVPVTPAEVTQTYRSLPKDSLPIIPIQYILRQIVVLPPEGDAKFAVRERLLEIRERIINGEKFHTLAVLYSEDAATARRGGELGLLPKQQFAAAFADAAMALKSGQVSPIVETEYGYHLIQLIEKDGTDMFNARHILMKPQYATSDRQRAFEKLDSIAAVIRGGELTFEQAAVKLSQDTKSNAGGGLVVNESTRSARFDKDQLHAADYTALRDMHEGDISAPYEAQELRTGKTQYKILQLESLIPSHPANPDDDYTVIRQLAQQQRQQAALETWIARKQAATYLRLDPAFRQCPFERNGWIK